MQALRKILVLTILTFLLKCGAQTKLQGTYKLLDNIAAVSEQSTEYIFSKDSHFIQTNYFHLGGKENYKGTYSIHKDSLILKYKELVKQSMKKQKRLNLLSKLRKIHP